MSVFSQSFFALSVLAALPVQVSATDLLPWERTPIPAPVAQYALLPDWVFCESPCEWRETLSPIFRPLVRDCATAREAVLKIAANMTAVTGVYYSMERRKPNMNALEALCEKKVSCTGQSILLVCALRSVGIPARVVWIMSWNHVPGNHTWTEAWVDGAWRMIEFNEKEFNTPWVMEGIGMLDTAIAQQRIYAVACGTPATSLPIQTPVSAALPAEDVSERYLFLARQWYAANGLNPDSQRIMVDLIPRREKQEWAEILDAEGRVLCRSALPTLRDDVRRFATLPLPRTGIYTLRTPCGTHELEATSQPVRIIRLRRSE